MVVSGARRGLTWRPSVCVCRGNRVLISGVIGGGWLLTAETTRISIVVLIVSVVHGFSRMSLRVIANMGVRI